MSTESNIQLTLGSLFDGSGGFPLGGLLTGCTMSRTTTFPSSIAIHTSRYSALWS